MIDTNEEPPLTAPDPAGVPGPPDRVPGLLDGVFAGMPVDAAQRRLDQPVPAAGADTDAVLGRLGETPPHTTSRPEDLR